MTEIWCPTLLQFSFVSFSLLSWAVLGSFKMSVLVNCALLSFCEWLSITCFYNIPYLCIFCESVCFCSSVLLLWLSVSNSVGLRLWSHDVMERTITSEQKWKCLLLFWWKNASIKVTLPIGWTRLWLQILFRSPVELFALTPVELLAFTPVTLLLHENAFIFSNTFNSYFPLWS